MHFKAFAIDARREVLNNEQESIERNSSCNVDQMEWMEFDNKKSSTTKQRQQQSNSEKEKGTQHNTAEREREIENEGLWGNLW